MFFEELSPYRYGGFSGRSLLWRELNVGWLDGAYQFAQGNICQFCSPAPEGPTRICRNGREIVVGHAEIRVRGRGRISYAAPTLIYHYIEVHRYLPPQEFIESVLASDLKRNE